ncbi:hypothetical protein C8F01DRAFT_1151499 [Mycena amicta]|nr:hypothetical protein C8F01DRAFT_1151499 [Mycena amicta]
MSSVLAWVRLLDDWCVRMFAFSLTFATMFQTAQPGRAARRALKVLQTACLASRSIEWGRVPHELLILLAQDRNSSCRSSDVVTPPRVVLDYT